MLLGELALLDGSPRSASAFAETDVVASWLSSDAVKELCTRHPQIGISLLYALGREASHKLRAVTARLGEYILATAPDPDIDRMVEAASEAQRQIERWPEDRVDAVLLALATAVADNAAALAEATVKETRIGNVADKAHKNTIASLGLFRSMAGKPGTGIVGANSELRVTEIATLPALSLLWCRLPIRLPPRSSRR